MRRISRFFHYASGEFLLTQPHRRANGGTIIFVRSLLVSILLYCLAILLSELLDPLSQMKFSWVALRIALKSTLPWYGAIFAGVYAALYARFSSQWTYLASLYNQIKSTEAQVAAIPEASKVITEMKAAFIEDADELHLALKPMYAALIRTWSGDEKVRQEFEEFAPGGAARLDSLLADVKRVVEPYEEYLQKRAIKAKKPQLPLPKGEA